MQIRWLRKALRSLEQAHDFLAQENPEAAIQLVLKIRVATEKLASFPTMGRHGRIEGTKELVIFGSPYLVIYRVKGQRIEILRVLHGSRKYP
jgi:toxin ParE1/3/4